MAIFDTFPYTNFHELNQDWIIKTIKDLLEEWSETSQALETWRQGAQATIDEYTAVVVEFRDFVTNYFDNLDVQQEINNKLDEMAEDGTLTDLIRPFLEEALDDAKVFVTPQMFGAVGNGVADDTTAMANALAFAKSHDSCLGVHVPKGTYLLSAPILLYSGCIFTGEGRESVITIPSTYNRVLLFGNETNATDITIKNVFFDLDDLSFTYAQDPYESTRGVIALDGVNGVLIDGVIIHNSYLNSTQVTENQPIWLQSCSNVEIKNCEIIHYAQATSGWGNGVWFFSKNADVENLNVHDNYFEGRGDEFISFNSGYSHVIKNISVWNNVFNGENIYGITLYTTGTTLETSIQDSIIRNNRFTGCNIVIHPHFQNVLVSDNYFSDNTVSDQAVVTRFITMAYVSGMSGKDRNLTITGNTINISGSTNIKYGIFSEGYIWSVRISNNKIIGATSMATDSNAIECLGQNSIVDNNYIYGFDIGIRAGRNLISCNKIEKSTTGVKTVLSNFDIFGNQFIQNNYGINVAFSYAEESRIVANKFEDVITRAVIISVNATSGIRLLLKDNTDYFNADAQRNLVEQTGTANYQLFGNYRYRIGAYSWSADDALDS